MNLTHDPWIPVIAADGRQRLVSLQEAFASAHEIRDLSVKPHEKIALLRLLICITQAALDGPKDFDAWETCRDGIQPAVKRYLEKWQSAFEMFGDGPRFLQVLGLKAFNEDKEKTWASKIELALASGNNPTLLDNDAHVDRALPEARLAVALVTFQSFSPGSPIAAAIWNGKPTRTKGGKPAKNGKTWSGDAPCLVDGSVHSFLLGGSLLDSIWLNLLSKETVMDCYGDSGWGMPVWEDCPSGPTWEDQPKAKGGGKEAIKSYLGRLVPLSRAVLVGHDRRFLVMSNGVEYPGLPIAREPSTTRTVVKEKDRLIGARLGRSVWRDLPSILQKRAATRDPLMGPMALQSFPGMDGVSLWVGALVPDEENSANLRDSIESAFSLPASMYSDCGYKLFCAGVAYAEDWAKALNRAVQAYWIARWHRLDGQSDLREALNKASSSDKKLARKRADQAEPIFWTDVEQRLSLLLQHVAKPDDPREPKDTEWGSAVWFAAQEAFAAACSHESSREIATFTLARRHLHLWKPKNDDGKDQKQSRTRKRK